MSGSRRGLDRLEITAGLTLLIVAAIVLGAFQFIFGRDPEQPFRDDQMAKLAALADAPPASLEIFYVGSRDTITDPAQIAEFLHLLVEPQVMPRHHSHPESYVGFQLQGSSAAYALSRDSEGVDQYWLQLEEGTVPTRTIKLFRSETLTSWLAGKGLLER